jgi:hypothetical protein
MKHITWYESYMEFMMKMGVSMYGYTYAGSVKENKGERCQTGKDAQMRVLVVRLEAALVDTAAAVLEGVDGLQMR